MLRDALSRGPVALAFLPICLATAAASLPAGGTASAAGVPPHRVVALREPTAAQRPDAVLAAAEAHNAAPLPAATTAPQPAPPSVDASPTLRSHEVFGFAPYWTLAQQAAFNVASLSTVAYFGVEAGPDGTIVQSGQGWTGYQSQALVDLVNRAHAAGDRAVLAVECFDQGALDRLSNDPAAQSRLADQLVAAVRAKNMDGVNLDFEGTGAADRAGMVTLVDTVASRLHGVNPHWQVTVDTYGGSATDPSGFFDVASMAPAVDGFFVMAYDMYRPGAASPNAALKGTSPSDADVVAGYTSAVPASKVILGIPFYGYQWKTATNAPGAAAQSGPAPLSYAQLAAAGTPVYWDPTADVPWTEYRDGSGQWYEAYFDDPHSVALKAQLADSTHLAGVGIWALGMDGNDPAMMAAVLGHAAPLKDYVAGPATLSASPATTTSTTGSTTTSSSSTTSTTRPAPVATPSSSPPSSPTGGQPSGGGTGGGISIPNVLGGGSTTTTTRPSSTSTTTTTRPGLVLP